MEQDYLNGEGEPLVKEERQQVGSGTSVVLRLTLNRPKSLNCLSLNMLRALQKSFDTVADDTAVRAVIISGAGRGFCAGHDLREITAHRADDDKGLAYFEELFDTCTNMMLRIASLPVPVIAQVHGVAAAAGCQLVASCDLAIAVSDTVFAVNGIDAGLFCSTPQVALSRNIPRKAALEMLMLGTRIDGERALALGLINRSVVPDALEKVTMEFATLAAQKSRKVVALGKQAFYRQVEINVRGAYEDMGKVIVENLMLDEAQSGIEAFLDKKTPSWD